MRRDRAATENGIDVRTRMTRRTLLNIDADERASLNNGEWFPLLSPYLRHDILRDAQVVRYSHGQLISARGDLASAWMCCLRGAVRVGYISVGGRPLTLDYLSLGTWFGDVAMFDGGMNALDIHSQGATTVAVVSGVRIRQLLCAHVELYEVLLRHHAQHTRELFKKIEGLKSLALLARLANQLLELARRHGVRFGERKGTYLGLALAQEEIALMVGASRQRVNTELKKLERAHAIRIDSMGVSVQNELLLHAIALEPVPPRGREAKEDHVRNRACPKDAVEGGSDPLNDPPLKPSGHHVSPSWPTGKQVTLGL